MEKADEEVLRCLWQGACSLRCDWQADGARAMMPVWARQTPGLAGTRSLPQGMNAELGGGPIGQPGGPGAPEPEKAVVAQPVSLCSQLSAWSLVVALK